MAKRFESWESAVASLIRQMGLDPNYSPRTLKFYEEQAFRAKKHIQDIYPGISPYDIGPDEYRAFIRHLRSVGLSVATQRDYAVALRKLCRFVGNHRFDDVRIIWPTDTRPNVDWLSAQQAREILAAPLTPIQSMLVTLELCMGLRRIEVLRLRVQDVHPGFIEVRGKGRAGGKLRSVPYHTRFAGVLARWMEHRNEMVAEARHRDPMTRVPDALLIHTKGVILKEYSDRKATGIDKILKDVCRQTGISFSHHTLRRTFAREMWRSGVSPATIAQLLGHESTDVTLKYIGANLDDMAQAMSIFTLQ